MELSWSRKWSMTISLFLLPPLPIHHLLQYISLFHSLPLSSLLFPSSPLFLLSLSLSPSLSLSLKCLCLSLLLFSSPLYLFSPSLPPPLSPSLSQRDVLSSSSLRGYLRHADTWRSGALKPGWWLSQMAATLRLTPWTPLRPITLAQPHTTHTQPHTANAPNQWVYKVWHHALI